MAATFAAESDMDVSTPATMETGFQTLRQHAETALPVAINSVHTATVGKLASPIDIGSDAGSAELAGSTVLIGWLLWQAWKRRVI